MQKKARWWGFCNAELCQFWGWQNPHTRESDRDTDTYTYMYIYVSIL